MNDMELAAQEAVAIVGAALPAMSEASIEFVRETERVSLAMCEQVEFPTEHLLHAGMYARTLHMEPGQILTGALLKIATTLVVAGDCSVFTGADSLLELRGYSVLPGSAGRKQIFVAHTHVSMTMLFPTSCKTVAECERQFTDEYAMLMTNRQASVQTLITGE